MGLSGTGRSREPGSGEVSDPGEMGGRSSRGACERGASEARGALPAATGFVAAFTVSLPRAQASPAGLGRAKVGGCFPHLLLPSRPASSSRQCLGRGSKQSGRSCTSSSPGLSRSESVRAQQGQPSPARLLPGSRCAPKCARRGGSMAAEVPVPCPEELAGQGEPCQSGREPGAVCACGGPRERAVPGRAGRALRRSSCSGARGTAGQR